MAGGGVVLVLDCSPRVALICLAEKGGGPTITLSAARAGEGKIEICLEFQFRALFT
jgi:hypothetical protein